MASPKVYLSEIINLIKAARMRDLEDTYLLDMIDSMLQNAFEDGRNAEKEIHVTANWERDALKQLVSIITETRVDPNIQCLNIKVIKAIHHYTGLSLKASKNAYDDFKARFTHL